MAMKLPPDVEAEVMKRAKHVAKVKLPEPESTAHPRTVDSAEVPTAAPDGMVIPNVSFAAGVFSAVLPVHVVSEGNMRSWRKRSNRTKAAFKIVSRELGKHLAALVPMAVRYHAGHPLWIIFTRLGGRKMDRSNLPAAFKAVEDALAIMLGADDGDDRWRPQWDQVPGSGPVGIRITIARDL